MMRITKLGVLPIIAGSLVTTVAWSQDQLSPGIVSYSLDNIVLFVCAVLVLFMQAGFAALEAGMSPLNNTVNLTLRILPI